MHTGNYRVKGMHCASCSSVIEKTFKKVEGVHSVEVNYGTEKAKVSFDPSKTNPHDLSKHIEPLGYSLEVSTSADTSALLSASEMGMSENEHAAHLGLNQSKKEKLAEVRDMQTKVFSAIPLAAIAAFVMGWDIFSQYGIVSEMSYVTKEFFHHLLPIIATYTLFVVGKPYLLGFYRFLRYGRANMDSLIGI